MKKRSFIMAIVGIIVSVNTLVLFQNCGRPNQFDERDQKSSTTTNNAISLTGPKEPAQLFIERLYQNILMREPGSSETASWVAYVTEPGHGCAHVVQIFVTCPEYTTLMGIINYNQALNNLYRGLLGRAPTGAEVATANPDINLLATELMATPMFQTYCAHYETMTP